LALTVIVLISIGLYLVFQKKDRADFFLIYILIL